MAAKQVRIAVIGCGMIGKYHLKALASIPEFKTVGVWDVNAEAAQNTAGEYGVPTYHSFEDLLADPEIDLVDICLPSGLHAEYGCRAAEAGKHVIVEKPIDITAEAAQRLVDTCHQHQVYLAVILQSRFAPSILKIKQAITAKSLGKIIAGEAAIKWFRDPNYYQGSQWKGTKRLDGGGALINQGIHTIDLLLWFLGDVRAVTSLVRTARHKIEVEDLALVIAEFQNGSVASITCSTALKPGYPERIEIYGEKGSIALEAGKIIRWDVEGCKAEDYLDTTAKGTGSSDPGGISVENHQRQLKAIATSLLKGEQPPVSGEEGMKALNFILDIYAANEKWLRKA